MGTTSRLMLSAITCLALTLAGEASFAISDCIYAGVTFSDGAVSCQAGRQFQCSNGSWDDLDEDCANPPPTPTVVNPADCSCTEQELANCARSGQACCVTLEAGSCTRSCCSK